MLDKTTPLWYNPIIKTKELFIMKVWIIGYYDAYDKEDYITKIVDSEEKAVEFCKQNNNEFFKYYYDEYEVE